MKKFSVFLRGENFFMNVDDAPQRVGFYTTRYVEAEDEAGAERLAVGLLRQDSKLRGNVLNDPSDPPKVFAEEIDEMESFDDVESLAPGLVIFHEDQVKH